MLWLDREILQSFNFLDKKMKKVTKVIKSHPLPTILIIVLVIQFQMIILKALKSIW